MALGNVIRELGVKVSLLFDKSKMEASKKAIDDVANGMKNIGIQVAGAASSLLGVAAISSHNSRELENNSAQLGINVERLQELEYAAKVTAGVSREELQGALEGVSKTLFEARNNNVEASRTLIRMGVPLSMITDKTITADKVLLNLSDRFKAMPDGMNKTALANETFGASGAKLIPLLNKGSDGIAKMGKEARNLGVVLSGNTIKKGAEFDRQLSKIWIVLKNITNVIGSELIKYLGPMVNEFQKFIVANRKFIALGIAAVMKTIGAYLKIVFSVVKVLGAEFKKIVMTLGGFEKVAKMVAVAFGIFTGAKILFNVYKLASALSMVVAGIVAITGPVGIVIAGFTALYFIVKDFFSTDSVIKKFFANFKESLPELIKSFREMFPEIAETFDDLIESFKEKFPNLTKLITGVFDALPKAIGIAMEWFDKIISKLDEVGTHLGVFKAIGKIGDWISEKTGQAGEALSAWGKEGAPKVANANQAVASQSVAKGPVSIAQGDKTLNATMNFNMANNANASQVSEAAGGGIKKSWDSILRGTRDQFIGGVAQ